MYYKIICDNKYVIYDSRTVPVLSASLSEELNKVPTAKFRLAKQHSNISKIKVRKSHIDIYQGSECIFGGLVMKATTDMCESTEFECEGYLGSLNESIIRTYDFRGTMEQYMQMIINAHNNTCSIPLSLNKCTVNEGIFNRASSQYPTIQSEFKKKIMDEFENIYIYDATHKGGINLIYETDFERSDQVIAFGKNLLDIKKYTDYSSIKTRLIPRGAKLENKDPATKQDRKDSTGENIKVCVDITSVNGGKDYVQNDYMVSEYGVLTTMNEWDKVTDPNHLKTKAEQYLNKIAIGSLKLELSALDLTYIGINTKRLKIHQLVQVSIPGYSVWLPTQKIEKNLIDPSQDKFTLGSTYKTLVDRVVYENHRTFNNSDILTSNDLSLITWQNTDYFVAKGINVTKKGQQVTLSLTIGRCAGEIKNIDVCTLTTKVVPAITLTTEQYTFDTDSMIKAIKIPYTESVKKVIAEGEDSYKTIHESIALGSLVKFTGDTECTINGKTLENGDTLLLTKSVSSFNIIGTGKYKLELLNNDLSIQFSYTTSDTSGVLA